MGSSVFDDLIKLGLPELPVMGPFALLTAASALGPVALLSGPGTGYAGLRDAPLLQLAVLAAGGVAFHVFAALGLALGYARLDARASADDAGAPALTSRALSRVPRMLAILVLFSLTCIAFTIVPAMPAILIGASDGAGLESSPAAAVFGVLVALAMPFAWCALVALSARLMVSAPLVVVEDLGVKAALQAAWAVTRGHTWAVTWRTGLGVGLSLLAVGMVSGFAGAGMAGVAGVVGGAVAFVLSCGVILPLDAVFIYGIYRRLRTTGSL